MLTAEQRAIVESTYQDLSSNLDAAGQLFYERLFELHPSVRPMFKANIMDQGRKLMQTIGVVVTGLYMPETLRPALLELGKRHVGYGVQPEHYGIVGEILLYTLAQVLDDKFTPEAQEAWLTLYQQVVKVVQQPTA